MSGVQLLLRLDMPLRVMVGVEHELPVYKVVPPILEGLNNGIQFQIVGRIPTLGLVELLTEIGNRVALLTEDTPNAHMGRVTCHLKRLCEIRELKDRCLNKFALDNLKRPLCDRGPYEWPSFGTLGYGGHNRTEALYESAVEGGQTVEAANVVYIS